MTNSNAVNYASRAKRDASVAQAHGLTDYGMRQLASAIENLAKAVEEIARKQA